MFNKLYKVAAHLWGRVRRLFNYNKYAGKIEESKFADSNFKGYQCQNCCTFFAKETFGELVDRTTSVKISKPYIKYSDEYQRYKPEINNPSRETTDYCPECSEEKEDIRKFKLIYQEEVTEA